MVKKNSYYQDVVHKVVQEGDMYIAFSPMDDIMPEIEWEDKYILVIDRPFKERTYSKGNYILSDIPFNGYYKVGVGSTSDSSSEEEDIID